MYKKLTDHSHCTRAKPWMEEWDDDDETTFEKDFKDQLLTLEAKY
jgi:hypothetical protein